MISVSLPQFIESLLGNPAPAKNPTAQAADFSSLMSDDTANPANPTSKTTIGTPAIAGASSIPLPAVDVPSLLASSEPIAANGNSPQISFPAPEIVGASDGMQPPAKPMVEDTGSPAISDAAIAVRTANAPQPYTLLTAQLNIGVDARKMARPTPSAVPTGPCVDAPPKLDDSSQDERQKPDASALTMQQALAAAALLSSPSTLQQPQQLVSGTRTGPAPDPSTLLVTKNLPLTNRLAGSPPSSEAAAPKESKGTSPAPPGLISLPSHSLALILDQQTPQGTQIHAGADKSVTSGLSQAQGSPEHSQGSDMHQLDALVRDIAELSGNSGRASMRITAQQLGPLDIRLHRSDAGMTVSIRTQSEQSQSTVAQAQHQLSDDMRANGLKVAATSVMLGNGGAGAERHDRQPLRFAAPIESAATQADQPQTQDEERPAGRYA